MLVNGLISVYGSIVMVVVVVVVLVVVVCLGEKKIKLVRVIWNVLLGLLWCLCV